MLTTHLKIAWRGITQNRLASFVNITGLALAVAACLLIGLTVQYEQAYDKQSPFAQNIWRAYNETVTDGKVVTQDANTHSILAPSLKKDLPEVVDFARLYNHSQKEVDVVYKNKPYNVSSPWMTDPGFLRMFPQRFIAGDATTCLKEPYTVVLTQTTASRLFGDSNPMGQVITVPAGWMAGSYTVTGVVADPPPNTHLKFGLLASYQSRYAQGHEDNWSGYWDYTYFQLAPGTDAAKVKRQLAAYSEQHLKKEGIRLNMQPFADIHLKSNLMYEIEPNGDWRTTQALVFIALFILAIAFVNYINLTTARSFLRMKEVAVRKVVGAYRRQLIGQFVVEGGVVSGLSILLALLLLWLALPFFETFLGKQLINYDGFAQNFWLWVPVIWCGAIVCACLYPAVALSRFSPLSLLRGRLGLPGKNTLRRVLVVFQFSCSVMLLIALLVVGQQLKFLRNHDKGLSLYRIVALKIPEMDWRQDSLNRQRVTYLRQQVAQLAGVKAVAGSNIVPGQGIATISGTSGGLFWTQHPEASSAATVYSYEAESSFFNTYSIRFLSGAPFEASDNRTAAQHVIINEAARRMFHFPDAQSAVGQEVAYRANPGNKMTVHGVVADFHIESSKEPVRPTLYYCTPVATNGYLSVKLSAADSGPLLGNLSQIWKEVFPANHFEPIYMQEEFNRQHKPQEQLAVILTGFTVFAVFIACLGLIGLAVVTSGQRAKEIGVRKVLGATVASLVGLLSKDYLKLVAVAVVIGSPVAGWLMHNWLQDFAYRIKLEWWMFLAAALLAAIAALVSVSLQAIKVARANPVKSLRTE